MIKSILASSALSLAIASSGFAFSIIDEDFQSYEIGTVPDPANG